ncbi:bacillithiol system protein YtxJ [Saonia flava]|uniref:Bacillithiol system protein YtxJ n=1 Tax=Saonia flava TaxID=523696 RepID=A0A846QRH1_9FLAO|nr:bacillithiol system redox-active protein YtxJ [Saonia flava]NJB69580.1 bacillithiol system protein YtxJ [Saonia flava]
MGLINSLFGKKNPDVQKEKKEIKWIPLVSINQLEEIADKSNTKLQIIFKHSTTCGISRMVFKLFTNSFEVPDNNVDAYYLDLHQYQEVSNETGYKFQVIHQSPQLLVIKNGVVVAHASHGAIEEIKVKDYI